MMYTHKNFLSPRYNTMRKNYVMSQEQAAQLALGWANPKIMHHDRYIVKNKPQKKGKKYIKCIQDMESLGQ